MKQIAGLFFSLIILSACNKGGKIADSNAEIAFDKSAGNAEAALPPMPAGTTTANFLPPAVAVDEEAVDGKEIDKKIIKEGEIHFETDNIAETKKAIHNQIVKLKGYVAGESEANNGENNEKAYTINAKIPAKNFDAFLSSVSATAVKIDSKNIAMRDVTAQYIDITTRLTNKKKLEERYLELLQKGTKIADLLEIENKLTEIRSDIESTQGQLNYLNKQIDYSSLDITFYARQTVKEPGQSFGYKIKKALGSGWESLGGWFFWFVGAWPAWLILAGIIIVIRRWRVNLLKRKNNT